VSNDQVCVIGAGPAGLTAIQVLRERDLRVRCFEKGAAIGGQWRFENESGTSTTYSSLELMSSRARTGYKRFRFPATASRYPRLHEVREYLEDFARTYRLFDDIIFDCGVTRVEMVEDGWKVTSVRGDEGCYRAVIVANGHHSVPHWPEVPTKYEGEVSHSAAYREPAPFRGKRVLVLGFGNSGADIAAELSTVASTTTLATRSTGHLLPKTIAGAPLDWFDTSAVTLIPFRLRQTVLATLLRVLRRDNRAYGIPQPQHGLLRRVPVTVPQLADCVRRGTLTLRPPIADADGLAVKFADGSVQEIDHILCATGFHVSHPFLACCQIDMCGPPLYRRIMHPDLPGLFFLGLIDPNGGILPVLETQCEWIADVLEGRIDMPAHSAMLRAVAREERAQQRRFEPSNGTASWLLCDRYPYMRRLALDRLWARVAPASRN
jgi:dimethylaniline monooxygenase (N-oxide forming)